jgi:hypothetical protein
MRILGKALENLEDVASCLIGQVVAVSSIVRIGLGGRLSPEEELADL